MKIRNILLLLTLSPLIIFGQFADKKTYNIKRVQNAPKINGKLDDPAWRNLDVAKDFSQISPNNGTPERIHQRTEVKICYDNKNIY